MNSITTISPATHAIKQMETCDRLTERYERLGADLKAAHARLPKDGTMPDLGLALGIEGLSDARAEIRLDATELCFRLVAVRGKQRFLPNAEAAAVEAAQDAVREASTLPRRSTEWTPEQFDKAEATNAARRADLEALYFRLGL